MGPIMHDHCYWHFVDVNRNFMGDVTAIVYDDQNIASERADERSSPFSVLHICYVFDGKFHVVAEQIKPGD